MFPVKQWAQDQLLWAERLTDSNLWSISSLETGLCVQLDFLPLNNCQPDGQWVLGSLVAAEGAWEVYNLRGLPPGIQKNLPEQQMVWVKPENHVFLLNIWSMLAYMEDSALQAFLLDVLSDDQLMLPFCTARASRSYHHNQQGGLLAHSCQVAMCAAMMCTQLHMGCRAAWVAFLGGLFHDLGKTWMFYNEEQGQGGQHESYGLILLASPLQKLRQQSTQLFEALAACLSPRKSYQHDPYQVSEIVRLCDRMSAAAEVQRSAFAGAPDYFWYASSPQDGRLYKRLDSPLF